MNQVHERYGPAPGPMPLRMPITARESACASFCRVSFGDEPVLRGPDPVFIPAVE